MSFSLDFAIPKVCLAFSNKATVGSRISLPIIFFGRNGLYQVLGPCSGQSFLSTMILSMTMIE